jgi:hypothetical protein
MQTFIYFTSSSIAIMLAFLIKKITVALPICVLFEVVVVGIADGLSFVNEIYSDLNKYVPSRMSQLFVSPEYFSSNTVIPSLLVCVAVIICSSLVGFFNFNKSDF